MRDSLKARIACPTGVEEHTQMNLGVPQELGRPCRSHGMIPDGDTG